MDRKEEEKVYKGEKEGRKRRFRSMEVRYFQSVHIAEEGTK